MGQTLMDYTTSIDAALETLPLLKTATGLVTPPSNPPKDTAIPEPLVSAMRYSLTLPGKRLRPALLLAAYHLFTPDWTAAMPFALALEMIHAYSLIHDDLPALDNDDLRRGKPTNHKVFGENIAILAGDGLYSLAFETMLDAAVTWPHPDRAIAAMEEIARRAGVRGMIAGQTLDVSLENTKPDEKCVAYIHRHKTADLITAGIMAGMLLGGANNAQLAEGQTYGQSLGMAFQIVDDLLDVSGNVAMLGKQTGKDQELGKMTWPEVYGVDASRTAAKTYIQKAEDAIGIFGDDASFFITLARQMLTRVS